MIGWKGACAISLSLINMCSILLKMLVVKILGFCPRMCIVKLMMKLKLPVKLLILLRRQSNSLNLYKVNCYAWCVLINAE